MLAVHAELTADQQRIVLLAGGDSDLEIAQAAKRLGNLTPLFEVSDPPGALTVATSWAGVVQLQATFPHAWVPGPRLCTWIERQVLARTSPVDVTYRPPAPLQPYPWQLSGAAMIAALGSALITDEPGTGKTATTILGLIEWASARHAEGPVVVVCPASVVDPWVQAWADWAPHVRAVAWRGAPEKRYALAGTADVYVTSYETARQDAPVAGTKAMMKALLNLNPAAVVVDECHLVKNPRAARSQAVRRLAKLATKQGGCVVGLSGTPITHHPADLWPILVALDPGAWPSRERWIARYCETLTGDYRDEILGLSPYTEPEFRTALLGQHRRVAKADVLTQLPPKVYSVRTVHLPGKWRRVYDDFEARMIAELPDDGGELSVMDALSVLTHLSRLACAPADVEVTYELVETDEGPVEKRHVHLELKASSWKVEALLEILEERPGQPVIAFAPSSQLMKLAGAAAAEAGLRVGYVIGGQTQKERSACVAAFQAGELDLICATTGAGGVGITLTAASTVVFLQRPWALVESIQAEDRAHRIGSEQHESIEVIDIVAANTIDSRVRAVLRERAGQLADLVQDRRIVTELLGGTGRSVARDASTPRLQPSAIDTDPAIERKAS